MNRVKFDDKFSRFSLSEINLVYNKTSYGADSSESGGLTTIKEDNL